jgi:8-oxo-dGTP diphosphatase
MIDSEKRIMIPGPPAGQRGTKRSPTMDLSPDSGDPFVKRVPWVDVRVILFEVNAGRLLVALHEQPNSQALPRGGPTQVESLDAAGARTLREHVGIAERYLEQLYSISHRSEGRWTVTVTYLALALAGDGGPPLTSAAWADAGNLPDMIPVERKIIDYALLRPRANLGYTTIAFHLLPPSFSLSEPQIAYEAVLDLETDKRKFRRKIHAAGVLEATSITGREGSHRPARLYRFRTDHETGINLTPGWPFGTEQEAANP